MKIISKLAIVGSIVVALSACSGTTYNKDRTCSSDYLLHPAISVPAAIGACKDYKAAE